MGGSSEELPFRWSLRNLRPFDHGMSVEDARQIAGGEVLNLSNNENAVGASPLVADTVRDAADTAWNYPDSACTALTAAIGKALALDPDRITCGTGSEALLAIIAHAALDPGDRVVLSSPTFPIYRSLAVGQNAIVVDVPRRDDHGIDLAGMAKALSSGAKLVFLCNPNNPTGTPIPPEDISAIGRMVGPNGIVVVDEAYHEFHQLDRPLATLRALDQANAPWFVLRTFSKAFALGGFRVGYAIARNTALSEGLDLVRPQFGVSTLAQRAAMVALSDRHHLEYAIAEIRRTRETLRAGLTALGLKVAPSEANFLYIESPPGTVSRILRHGVMARALTERHMRLTVCRQCDAGRVLEAFRAAMG